MTDGLAKGTDRPGTSSGKWTLSLTVSSVQIGVPG